MIRGPSRPRGSAATTHMGVSYFDKAARHTAHPEREPA